MFPQSAIRMTAIYRQCELMTMNLLNRVLSIMAVIFVPFPVPAGCGGGMRDDNGGG